MRRRQVESAASFIEFVIGLPVFFAIILATFDFGRFLVSYSFLNYAALYTAQVASGLELETNLKNVNVAGDPSATCSSSTSVACSEFAARLRFLIQTGENIAGVIVPRSSAGGRDTLTRFVMFDNSIVAGEPYSSQVQNIEGDILILRPGERGRRVRGRGRWEEFNLPDFVDHPTRPFAAMASGVQVAGTGWPIPPETWSQLLDQHPVVVVIEASFRPITPLIP